MHRVVVVVAVLLAACGFTPGADPFGTDGGGAVIARSCHVQGSQVRLCLDFEDPSLTPTVYDGSSGEHDASATDVASMPRANQRAALVESGSQMVVPETPDLDITPNLTIEMWLQPSQTMWNTTWPLSNAMQYGLGLSAGAIACAIGNETAWSESYLETNRWTHVACTYDGTTITAYVDGDVSGCQPTHGPIPIAGTSGTAIGGNGYLGGVDDIHVYAGVLDAATICQLSGHTDCHQSCPSSGLGD